MKWRKIDGWDEYSVSDLGEVRRDSTKRILVGGQDRGYRHVVLSQDGRRKTMPIHRLVAIAFVPNTSGEKTVNHIDGNKLNNHFSNLEWISLEDNIRHSWTLSSSNERKKRISEANKGRKWSEEDREKMSIRRKGLKKPDSMRLKLSEIKKKRVIRVEDNQIFNSIQDAADDCKIDRSGISDVLHGRRKTAGGYHWAFHSEVRKCS